MKTNKVKIFLTEFGESKSFYLNEIKKWFPGNKFDKRYPIFYLKKWINVNSDYLKLLGISWDWNDDLKSLTFTPGNKIGVVPLKNPFDRKVYGYIVVKPRINWIEIYEILEDIEWKYQPIILKDEEPISSDGFFPRWFKAIHTLEAISEALNLYMKKLITKKEITQIPKGIIDWHSYFSKSIPYGKYNQFFSEIPDYSFDLKIHRQFKGILKLIADDITSTKVPFKIKKKAKQLIYSIEKQLQNVKFEKPNLYILKSIKFPNYYRQLYEKATKSCIDYLNQSKFSLNTGNFYGFPWAIEMDRLFEYWVEYWANIFARKIGARFYSDIKNNSKIKFYNKKNWKSLSQLKPDIIIEKESKTLFIEVKYKKHLMYLQYGNSTEIIEDHRHDIHQLLSYMCSSTIEKRIGCIIYPKIDDSIINQYSSLINYTNTTANVDIVLCGINFKSKDFMNTLEGLWKEEFLS